MRAHLQRDGGVVHVLDHALAKVDPLPHELAGRVLAERSVERAEHLPGLDEGDPGGREGEVGSKKEVRKEQRKGLTIECGRCEQHAKDQLTSLPLRFLGSVS
jgi:hypothetical protein